MRLSLTQPKIKMASHCLSFTVAQSACTTQITQSVPPSNPDQSPQPVRFGNDLLRNEICSGYIHGEWATGKAKEDVVPPAAQVALLQNASSDGNEGTEEHGTQGKPVRKLPSWYGPILHIAKPTRLQMRLRAEKTALLKARESKRGKLLPGWRPIVHVKKLLLEFRKTESFLSTAPTADTKVRIKLKGLEWAGAVVPNLRCLESLLFTSFVEFEVKAAVSGP